MVTIMGYILIPEKRRIRMSAKLTCVSTGSIGNAYILECNGEKLLIELGVKWKDIMKGVGYDLSNIAFCLVTHQHGDHTKSIPEALKYGLKIYSTPDVAELYPKVKALETMKRYKIGNWKVLPLRVPHGECECFSYHVTMPDGQTLLFATDLESFPYKIGCNHLMLECNYSEDILINKMLDNVDIRSASNTHMELNTTISVIQRLYSPNLRLVILLHLSAGLSDENGFKKAIFEQCGVRAEVADANMTFELNNEDF